MSLTIADETLSRRLEPNVCTTVQRYKVLKEFQKYGIPTVVWMTPLLPFITDTKENVNAILDYCIDAGVKGIVCFNIGMTLRDGDREYYYMALDRQFPGLSDIYRRKYGKSYEVISDRNDELMKLFHDRCERSGVVHSPNEIQVLLIFSAFDVLCKRCLNKRRRRCIKERILILIFEFLYYAEK